jgi:hypothetical protein
MANANEVSTTDKGDGTASRVLVGAYDLVT